MSPSQSALPFPPADRAGAAFQALMHRALPAEPGVWDELRGPDGQPRPAWRLFGARLPAPPAGLDGEADLDRRVAQVAQQIRRDGVTHNVFGADGVAARPWSLELLPLLIDAADWARLEGGIAQRAALMEAMLADLYGPQRLLHEALLPPALLLRHPGYLRPVRGLVPPGGRHLGIVAFDVARGPDGAWWVISQRTQGPSGLGYVLHNRLTVSRQFPEAFRDLRVQHLASGYRRLLDTLEQLATTVARGATPRLALLTPGPYTETYFEHAYLARYLGLPLVEGGDLSVRGDRLYLKTVEGLEPVHGLLRRLDDDWCDPLELRPDSTLGVPGLLQVARAGNLAMANALGAGVLETPAIQGFLPAIARRLLGEPLALPSVPTWWCGEAAAWEAVRGQLDGKVLRGTFVRAGRPERVHGSGIAEVERDPDAWTAQGWIRYSRAPIWGAGMLTPRPALVRVYAIADAKGRWHVLPGGMTRVARAEEASVSMQQGGTSLDTWVLTDGPVDSFSMLPQRLRVDDLAARRGPVSSRTGENLFWLGRYTERTEQQVRLARTTLLLIDSYDDAGDADDAVRAALSALAVRQALAPPGVPTLLQSPPVFERALLRSLVDAGGSQGIAFNLAALHRASQALRERLSSEQWGLIRGMDESFAAALRGSEAADADEDDSGGGLPDSRTALAALEALAIQLAAVTGAQTDRMTRDHGWRLLAVGRLLERLIGVTGCLEAFADHGALRSAAGVELLLELFDSAITFRARYQRHEDLLAVADLLVLDGTNPRAFAGVLRRLRTELSKLPGGDDTRAGLLARLPPVGAGLSLEQLRGADNEQIARLLLELARSLKAAALSMTGTIGSHYFTPAHGVDRSI